nr:hypothetical protein Itr_chr07CG07140 [Ipomoea trifida]
MDDDGRRSKPAFFRGGGGPGPAKQRPSPSFPAVMAVAAAWLGEVDAEVISIVAAVNVGDGDDEIFG